MPLAAPSIRRWPSKTHAWPLPKPATLPVARNAMAQRCRKTVQAPGYHHRMLIETLGAAHELGRLKEILGVMVRHGFGDTVRRLGLADQLERADQALHWNLAGDLTRIEPPVQVRLALEELGPTFVKFGQLLAGRADLFGPDWIAEFEKLHSQVPAV